MWSIGLRAGADIVTDGANIQSRSLGSAASLQVGYRYYWPMGVSSAIGVRTGLGIGYHTVTNHDGWQDAYTRYDYYGNRMDYTISAAHIHRTVRCTMLDVPLMLAMRFGGVTIDVGARAHIPFSGRVSQSVEDLHMSAYYVSYNVKVPDELIIGNVTDAMLYQKKPYSDLPHLALSAAIEMSYEWELSNGHLFGLGLWLDVPAWSLQHISFDARPSVAPLIDVANITDPVSPVPDVTIGIRPLGNEPRAISVGLLLSYNFGSTYQTGARHRRYNHRTPCRCYE